jgi:NADH:ubiquinone oxidoreductase subunit F (NADH-binding)
MATEAPVIAGQEDGVSTTRVLAAWTRTGRADLEAHLDTFGSLALPHGRDGAWADGLVEHVRSSGLVGRGGAGFPTARKLDSMRSKHPRPLLAVNAMEGEPASEKDRTLLAVAPHLVLDGAELVATAVAHHEIVVCVADDQGESAQSVRNAMAERAAAGLARIPVKLLRPPGRYISGEESALVAWIRGGPAHPQFRAGKGVPLTIGRRPVLVQSAETLAHVALIARYGPGWFRTAGLADAPGTCLVTASGALELPGVYEVGIGATVGSILRDAGLGELPKAVLVGGYGGAWLHPDHLETPYAPGPLAAVGSAMGAGVLAALPASSCGVAETARVAAYMANESAGQCGPCLFGLHAIAQDLVGLARAEADRSVLARLRHRLGAVDGRGACRHPDGVVRLVRSALEVFAGDFNEHARHRPCAGWNRKPVLPVPQSAVDAVGRKRQR